MTAVEWLINQLTDEPEHYLFLCDKPEYMYGLTKILEQALEMEKKQIIEAYNDGQAIPPFDYAEKYYDRNYKKP